MLTILAIAGMLLACVCAWLDGRATGRRETQTAIELAFVRQDLAACYGWDTDWRRETHELERLPDAAHPS